MSLVLHILVHELIAAWVKWHSRDGKSMLCCCEEGHAAKEGGRGVSPNVVPYNLSVIALLYARYLERGKAALKASSWLGIMYGRLRARYVVDGQVYEL
jgi:hypothetical protein